MPTSELERIVQEIKLGKRLVLLPPGALHLAAIIVMTMIGFVFFISSTLQIFAKDLPIPTLAKTQLSSIIIPMVGAALPAFMIVRGKKWYALWLRYFIFALAFITLATAIFALATQDQLQGQSLLISLAFLSAAIWLSSRAKFLLLCEFFYLLKKPE